MLDSYENGPYIKNARDIREQTKDGDVCYVCILESVIPPKIYEYKVNMLVKLWALTMVGNKFPVNSVIITK